MTAKQIAGEKATEWVKSGMKVGLGTGSTAYYATKKLGELVRNGLEIQAVATSLDTELLAKEEGIPLMNLAEVDQLDITIDGADEFTPRLELIKGGGGALYREKVIASISKTFLIVADDSKYCEYLGAFPLPVEVVPFGFEITYKRLKAMGIHPNLRKKDDEYYLTDNGNYIFDCQLGTIQSPKPLHEQLKSQLGVVETGLFTDMATAVIMANSQGQIKIWKK